MSATGRQKYKTGPNILKVNGVNHDRRRAKQFGGQEESAEYSEQNNSKCVVCSQKKKDMHQDFPLFFLKELVYFTLSSHRVNECDL